MLKNNPTTYDFDDDQVDDVGMGKNRGFTGTEDTTVFNNSEKFVVNRPKPLKSSSDSSTYSSKPTNSSSPRVMNPDPISEDEGEDEDESAMNYVPGVDHSPTPPVIPRLDSE